MTKKQAIYAPEFRQQMVELHLAGRSLNELAREFGCGSSTIAHWVAITSLLNCGSEP